MSIEGAYRTKEPAKNNDFHDEIIVLRRAPDDHNGKGVHWHAVGDTTGYGWMSLEHLGKQYIKIQPNGDA